MVWQWEPGTRYDYGAVVEYEGHRYKIIQPHQSQGDWTPPVTPALWGRCPDDHQHDEGAPPPQKDWSHETPSYEPQGGFAAPHPNQQVNISHEERKKKWYELDDNRKNELELGGGLLAGAAALGAGYFAYKHHQKSEEEKKATAWALQNWLHDAQRRTDEINNVGSTEPVYWVLSHGKNIPREAIEGGNDSGHTLYIARAFQDGGIQPGKASDWFQKGAVIGYQRDEIQLETFEVLVGNRNAVKWVDVVGTFQASSLGAKPVEGGHENNGTKLYIAQAPYNDWLHPGKVAEGYNGALIPYGGAEKEVKEYRVLCYNTT
jgi:hypothetical protein